MAQPPVVLRKPHAALESQRMSGTLKPMTKPASAWTRRTMIGAGLAALAAPSVRAAPATTLPLQIKPDRELMVPVEGGRLYVRVKIGRAHV